MAAFFIIALLAGFIISLVIYIPPLYSLAQMSSSLRLLLAFSLGLISFFLLYGVQTYSMAHASYHSGDLRYECHSCDLMIYVPPEHTQKEKEAEQAIILEYWSREILPPIFQSGCNTKHSDICQMADAITSRKLSRSYRPEVTERQNWNMFLLYFGISTSGTISTIFCIARFTRRNDVHRRISIF